MTKLTGDAFYKKRKYDQVSSLVLMLCELSVREEDVPLIESAATRWADEIATDLVSGEARGFDTESVVNAVCKEAMIKRAPRLGLQADVQAYMFDEEAGVRACMADVMNWLLDTMVVDLRDKHLDSEILLGALQVVCSDAVSADDPDLFVLADVLWQVACVYGEAIERVPGRGGRPRSDAGNAMASRRIQEAHESMALGAYDSYESEAA